MAFKKGEPRAPSAGRRKGTPNASTRAVKEALHEAFEGAGGVPALIKFAKKNPAAFYQIWVKLLPHEIVGKDGGAIQITEMTDADIDQRIADLQARLASVSGIEVQATGEGGEDRPPAPVPHDS